MAHNNAVSRSMLVTTASCLPVQKQRSLIFSTEKHCQDTPSPLASAVTVLFVSFSACTFLEDSDNGLRGGYTAVYHVSESSEVRCGCESNLFYVSSGL